MNKITFENNKQVIYDYVLLKPKISKVTKYDFLKIF